MNIFFVKGVVATIEWVSLRVLFHNPYIVYNNNRLKSLGIYEKIEKLYTRLPKQMDIFQNF